MYSIEVVVSSGNMAPHCKSPITAKRGSSDLQLLDKWLGLFADEARKTNGSYYPARTVHLILAGLYRYMRSLNPSWPNFLSDGHHFRSIHDAVVTERGNAAEYKTLRKEEQDKLLASGTLSIKTHLTHY